MFRNVLGYVKVTQNSKCYLYLIMIMAIVSIVIQRRITNYYNPNGKALIIFLIGWKKDHKAQEILYLAVISAIQKN